MVRHHPRRLENLAICRCHCKGSVGPPRGVPPENLGRGVQPASQNPHPIYDHNNSTNQQQLYVPYPKDLNDNSKTYALVDDILQQKIDHKGLKRGDNIIAINEHTLQDKTYKEVQCIIRRLHPRQQIILTVESRQWRQYGKFPN